VDFDASLLPILNTSLMAVALVLFMRGDILPRRVYEEMITRVVTEVATRVVASVRDMLDEWEQDTISREARVHWETSKLQRENQALVEELEWDSALMRKPRDKGGTDDEQDKIDAGT